MTDITLPILAMAFFNCCTNAIEEYGGNTDRVYSYIRGMCDLIDAIAELTTDTEEEEV